MTEQNNWPEKLVKLHRVAITVAGAHNVDEALQLIADAARELANAEMAAIGVPGRPGEPMAQFVVSGLPPEVVERAGHPPMGRGVLGVLLEKGEVLRSADITRHPAYRGIPEQHPEVRSFLGIPVTSQGEVIGDLYLANRIGADTFSEVDQQVCEMLAAHAAVVIQTLRDLARQEEMAVLRAQARLAPRIEDDVLQALYGAGLMLNRLELCDEAITGQVQAIQKTLDNAIRNLRSHLMALSEGAEEA